MPSPIAFHFPFFHYTNAGWRPRGWPRKPLVLYRSKEPDTHEILSFVSHTYQTAAEPTIWLRKSPTGPFAFWSFLLHLLLTDMVNFTRTFCGVAAELNRITEPFLSWSHLLGLKNHAWEAPTTHWKVNHTQSRQKPDGWTETHQVSRWGSGTETCPHPCAILWATNLILPQYRSQGGGTAIKTRQSTSSEFGSQNQSCLRVVLMGFWPLSYFYLGMKSSSTLCGQACKYAKKLFHWILGDYLSQYDLCQHK